MTLENPRKLFIKNLILFHSQDDMIKSFPFCFDLLLLILDFRHLLKFLVDLLLERLDGLMLTFDPFLDKVYVFFLECDRGHVLFGLFVHLIIILS